MNDRINNLYAEASARIEGFNAAIIRGEEVDLTGIDKMVAGLCAEIIHLPAEDGKNFKPKLEGLIEALKQLSENLHKKQDEIKQQMMALNKQQQAAKAYINSEHLDNKKPEGNNG